LGSTRRRWANNIKMDLNEIGWVYGIYSMWLSTGVTSRLFQNSNEHLGSSKGYKCPE
jgi:hypothetical protein